MKKYDFRSIEPWPGVNLSDWSDWKWQFRNALKNQSQFSQLFDLTENEKNGFKGLDKIFRVQTTPYYSQLIDASDCPVRQMVIPQGEELTSDFQEMLDPLGENKSTNRPSRRLVHRYSDRALFLLTDLCSVYCRYCTRKHFTASDQVVASEKDITEAIDYISRTPSIKEVIFSGGDPLTVSNDKLAQTLERIYEIPHVELIRMGTRMPVVAPMRIDDELISIFQEFKPVYLMTHFNHPKEITVEAAVALEKLVDHGVPVMNQMVLLNGINNHEAVVYALSRRLLSLRVKPYYMFQADPSIGTDHLRNSIDDSLHIQKQMWGHTSGLAMPNYVVDIPEGGGKAPLSPNYLVSQEGNTYNFKGWDNVEAQYVAPSENMIKKPKELDRYLEEWRQVTGK